MGVSLLTSYRKNGSELELRRTQNDYEKRVFAVYANMVDG